MMSRLEIVLDDLEIGYGIWLTIYFKFWQCCPNNNIDFPAAARATTGCRTNFSILRWILILMAIQ